LYNPVIVSYSSSEEIWLRICREWVGSL